MLKTFLALRSLLTAGEQRRALLVFLMMLGMAALETIGVASIMPFMGVLTNPEIVETNPWLNKAFLLSGVESTNAFLILLGVAIFFILLSSLAFRALTQWAQISFAQKRIHTLGCRLMIRYISKPYSWFLGQHSSKVATSILSEVTKVITGSLIPFMQLVAHSLVAIFLFSLLVFIDPLLAFIVAIALTAVYGSLYLIVRKHLTRIGTIRLKANREKFHVTHETFGGIKDVKVYGLEHSMLERFTTPSRRLARQEVLAQVIGQLPSHAVQALIYGGVISILIYLIAAHGSVAGALPVFATFAFAGYRLMPALQNIYRQIANLRVTRPALTALATDLRENQDHPGLALDNVARRTSLKHEIVLQNICYAYPDTKEYSVKDLSMTIPAKTTIGLVGTTGSGKTTTLDLLLGLLHPQYGEILVDGEALTSSTIRAWQRSLGYVPQHIYLADETIAGNIAFGLATENIDMQAVEKAAKIACLHDFVINELEQGYQTVVGERGVRLSGGQRQRIGIARALYNNPDVLLLDEATSALDNVTENAVMAAVNNLGKEITIIIIAHRLSTVQKCDTIHVLDKGHLIASGTYEELSTECPAFQKMVSGGDQ